MPRFEITNALDGAPEFVAEADGAMLVTEESLAAAIHRAFPARRNTESGLVLTAAVILAALRTEP